MKKRVIPILSLCVVISRLLLAQQPSYPYLLNVQIKALTSYDNSDQMFHYSYTLVSSDTNVGKIDRFEIDVSRGPDRAQIDTIGLRFENDGYTEKIFRRAYSRLAGKIVPVGFLRTPPGLWSGTLTNARTAAFSGVKDQDFVLPGRTLNGFEIMSKGLPAIRRCIVSPFFDVIALFPDPDDTTITYHVPPVDSVRNVVKFHAYTIGAMAPPAIFNEIAFLDTLISYHHQAFALGWIKEEGIVTSLDARLEAARPQMIADRPSAKNILQSFVNELDALNTQGNQITSEAYALLKFNAQYLMSKL